MQYNAEVVQGLYKIPENKKSTYRFLDKCLNLLGWGTRARTSISGVRVRRLTIRPSPNIGVCDAVRYIEEIVIAVKKKRFAL